MMVPLDPEWTARCYFFGTYFGACKWGSSDESSIRDSYKIVFYHDKLIELFTMVATTTRCYYKHSYIVTTNWTSANPLVKQSTNVSKVTLYVVGFIKWATYLRIRCFSASMICHKHRIACERACLTRWTIYHNTFGRGNDDTMWCWGYFCMTRIH